MLLVDDEPLFLKVATRTLERLGAHVLQAASGVEAFKLFCQRKEKIDLLLCDVSMAQMNGWQTMDAIREVAPTLPVILSSGYHGVMRHAPPLSPPKPLFLPKPYKPEALHSAILQALAPTNT